MNKRLGLGATVLGLGGIVGVIFYLSNPTGAALAGPSDISQVYVGGDLHTLTSIGGQLYVTGHEAAGVSGDGGMSWMSIPSLNYADVMGWSKTSDQLLVGGHPGLYKSTDGGVTFTKISFFGDVSDVHSIGAAGKVVYLGSPQVGLLASADDGTTWKLRNQSVGQGFMGSILVDPANPQRLIAPDMQAGLVTSNDGGLTWKTFGGPAGAMAVAWNPRNVQEVSAIGMNGSAITNDGGQTWQPLSLPKGSSALTYSEDGKKMYVAILVDTNARIFTSENGGKNWAKASVTTLSGTTVMDPNMPGMTQGNAMVVTRQRPVAFLLGTFGLATSSIFLGALVMRRNDRTQKLRKATARAAIAK
jgi:photosystem II stability/assembly factor-like uncharacterized protein